MKKAKLYAKQKEKYLWILFVFFLAVLVCVSFWRGFVPQKTAGVSVVNFGDVMFDRGVRSSMENKGNDPFQYIKRDIGLLKPYDVFIANLEGPIVEMDRGLCQDKAFNFQFASNTPDRLKSVGITMVNIANNHAYDCYQTGETSTKNYLTKAGIDYIGDDNLNTSYVIKTIKGEKVAFIGMDQTVQMVSISSFYPLVKKLASENDLVVIDIHWGTEYSLVATPVQTAIAHELVDSGASVIFGHHPHVVEPVEVYKGKAIFYSLGNFVFDQTDADTKIGLGVGVEFGAASSTPKASFTLFPFDIKSFSPDFMTGSEKQSFCDAYLSKLPHTGCQFQL